jgi:TfoX/Sxy family transcriptional regulator of competence genes
MALDFRTNSYLGGANMASSKAYLDFILGQLSKLEDITFRAMMGEYILYYKGKIVGGIYDDRLFVKPVKAAIAYMPAASYELPYDGAKEMLLVDEVDDREYLTGLFEAMYAELPTPKPKKKKYQIQFLGGIIKCFITLQGQKELRYCNLEFPTIMYR